MYNLSSRMHFQDYSSFIIKERGENPTKRMSRYFERVVTYKEEDDGDQDKFKISKDKQFHTHKIHQGDHDHSG